MLDVHPPHHATHTWTDFFIHIATIVVGLLIAIGLEQLVEHVHERYQLREMRQALLDEEAANRRDFAENSINWRWEMVALENDLMVLRYVQQHPGTPQTKLPGVLFWDEYPIRVEDAAWAAAEQNGLVHLMPLEEANRLRRMYSFLDGLTKQNLDDWDAFNKAHRFDVIDGDPTHLTPSQLEQTIEAVEEAIQRHTEVGYSLALLHGAYPQLGSTITYPEVESFHHSPVQEDPAGMAAANKLTMDRLKSAGYNR